MIRAAYKAAEAGNPLVKPAHQPDKPGSHFSEAISANSEPMERAAGALIHSSWLPAEQAEHRAEQLKIVVDLSTQGRTTEEARHAVIFMLNLEKRIRHGVLVGLVIAIFICIQVGSIFWGTLCLIGIAICMRKGVLAEYERDRYEGIASHDFLHSYLAPNAALHELFIEWAREGRLCRNDQNRLTRAKVSLDELVAKENLQGSQP